MPPAKRSSRCCSTPTGDLTVSNTFSTNPYGEVGLAFGTTPLRTPTDAGAPGTAGRGRSPLTRRPSVTLDDGADDQLPRQLAPRQRRLIPPYLDDPTRSASAPPRLHRRVIVDFRNNTWKFQPLAPSTDCHRSELRHVQRSPARRFRRVALGDGDLTVASFNVLNYFTTLGANVAGCTVVQRPHGNPITVNSPGCDQRGAWDPADLARQQLKIVEAINALDAERRGSARDRELGGAG